MSSINVSQTNSSSASSSKKDKATSAPALRVDENANLWIRDAKEGEWARALYLNEYRNEVDLQETLYDHEPAKGTEPGNVTSYLKSQESWGRHRENFPSILFAYQRQGRPKNPGDQLNWLRATHKGQSVYLLNNDGHLIRDFKVLPLTLSTKIEGFRIEAFKRLDDRIKLCDLQDRMMPTWNAMKSAVQIPKGNDLNMRMLRFRRTHRCLAWGAGNGTAFRQVMEHEMTDKMIKENTTKTLRPLSKKEVAWVDPDTEELDDEDGEDEDEDGEEDDEDETGDEAIEEGQSNNWESHRLLFEPKLRFGSEGAEGTDLVNPFSHQQRQRQSSNKPSPFGLHLAKIVASNAKRFATGNSRTDSHQSQSFQDSVDQGALDEEVQAHDEDHQATLEEPLVHESCHKDSTPPDGLLRRDGEVAQEYPDPDECGFPIYRPDPNVPRDQVWGNEVAEQSSRDIYKDLEAARTAAAATNPSTQGRRQSKKRRLTLDDRTHDSVSTAVGGDEGTDDMPPPKKRGRGRPRKSEASQLKR